MIFTLARDQQLALLSLHVDKIPHHSLSSTPQSPLESVIIISHPLQHE